MLTMRIYFLLFVAILFVSRKTVARPTNGNDRSEGETEEMEYEIEESPSDDSVQEYDEAHVNDQASNELEDQEEENSRQEIDKFNKRQSNLKLPVPNKSSDSRNDDNVIDYERTGNKQGMINSVAQSNDYPLIQKQRIFNKYIDNDNHMGNSRYAKFDKNNIDKHNEAQFYGNEIFFETQRETGKKEHNRNNDGADSNECSRNSLSEELTVGDNLEQIDLNMNRDRREIEKNDNLLLSSTSTEKTSQLFNSENEEEEAAIKRHIKKLSGEELEELLNSLSEDKKMLLSKIIENNQGYDVQNKREITKKASASDENSFIDGGLLELSKSQGLSSQADVYTESVVSQNIEKEVTKPESQSESSDSTSTKVPDSTRDDSCENKVELNVDNVHNNENVESKMLKSKRDTNPTNKDYKSFNQPELLDSYPGLDYLSNDQNNDCASNEEGLEQQLNVESESHSQIKRELLPTKEYNMNDIKSLEESFPNNNYEHASQYTGDNMVPLVRVKRKNDKDIQRRSILPDDKIAYLPYNAENDDIDNDDGNEFNDDGFYERTSNYAQSNKNKLDESIKRFVVQRENRLEQSHNKAQSDLSDISTNNKFHDGTRSLGSDTDSVLSGIEGVDDNLMLNSATRDRRALDGNMKPFQIIDSKRYSRSTPIRDDATAIENKSFGSIGSEN